MKVSFAPCRGRFRGADLRKTSERLGSAWHCRRGVRRCCKTIALFQPHRVADIHGRVVVSRGRWDMVEGVFFST
jgi:hypothetical protein